MTVSTNTQRGGKGDGLIGRIIIDEATCDQWVGPYGAPSAAERAGIERGLDRMWWYLKKDIITELTARETRRNEETVQAAADAKALAEKAAQDQGDNAPVILDGVPVQ